MRATPIGHAGILIETESLFCEWLRPCALPRAPTASSTPAISPSSSTSRTRWCLHRNADLRDFGEIEQSADGTTLVCTMHGWRFDCRTGRCLTARDDSLAIRPRDP